MRDSIDAEAIKLKSQFSAIEYQTSELKQQNQQLLTQNQKITIGASSVGVLLLGGLFARHYRARKKEVQLLRERQAADDEIFQLLQQQQEKVEEGRKLEKRRISQELHDGVMGKLSGIRLNLFVLNKRNDPETVSKCLGHIDKIQEVEKEIRSIAYDLENDLFREDRSFSALLRTLVQSAKDVSTTQFHLDLDAAIQWDAIPNTVKIQLYRVLQEALTNIRKYAQAKEVHITLRQRKQHLWVRVADDGVGFHPTKVKKGLGLDNMENRIRRQGGNFKAKSAEGRGTTLLFTLPTLTKESHRDDE
ncbi:MULTISPECIES: sensor histidine kinase [unclassified Flavobacterium]|uniref:sensor histidine kinase n=1 Tax=unclassified Flavobacterium TaxID=196869 RepID=UPI001F13010D|nr:MULTISPECIES: ATP-binding protein [unclassified Flavobacterium]UMY66513.1 ATP-binding protein [Flavobacterium sp. HJ-32-4]